MKKIVTLISAIVFTASAVNAQDLMSKKGTPILYEAGDYGIGIDANPLLQYFGNAFNHDANTNPNWDFTDGTGMTITGLMVKDVNTAYRAKLRIGIGSNKNVYKVDNQATVALDDFGDDERKISYRQITLGGGIQKMRGKGRLRGMYGAEAMIGLGGGKTEHTFANAITATNNTPATAIPGQPNIDGSRTTESKAGSTFMFGVRGFIGAEYFFAPKISIAGEFGWGPRLESTGEGETTTEAANFNALGEFAGITTTTTNTGKSSAFSFDTDNNNGTLRLTLYF